jgi:hypothetical protein
MIVDRLKEMKLHSGDILLFHDDYRHTVDALPRVLELLTSQGWKLASLATPYASSDTQRAFPSVR